MSSRAKVWKAVFYLDIGLYADVMLFCPANEPEATNALSFKEDADEETKVADDITRKPPIQLGSFDCYVQGVNFIKNV